MLKYDDLGRAVADVARESEIEREERPHTLLAPEADTFGAPDYSKRHQK